MKDQPKCRKCGKEMSFLGEDSDGKTADRWYCYKTMSCISRKRTFGNPTQLGKHAIASILHYFYIRQFHYVSKIMGVSTGIGELYDLTTWIVIFEVAGFLVACFATLYDARRSE